MALYILVSNSTLQDVTLQTTANGRIHYFSSYEQALLFAQQNQLKDYHIFERADSKRLNKPS